MTDRQKMQSALNRLMQAESFLDDVNGDQCESIKNDIIDIRKRLEAMF